MSPVATAGSTVPTPTGRHNARCRRICELGDCFSTRWSPGHSFIRPRPGQVNIPLGSPGDCVVVDELTAVIKIHPRHLELDHLEGVVDGLSDVNVGVVADTERMNPTGMHIGEIHGSNKLALRCLAAVGECVDFDKPGNPVNLITGCTDSDGRVKRAWPFLVPRELPNRPTATASTRPNTSRINHPTSPEHVATL